MSLVVFLLFMMVSAAAAFIQGATGMGFALIVAPVFGLFYPEFLPSGLLILMLPLNMLILWRDRIAIDWRGTGWITFGRFWGTFGGLWVLSVLTAPQLTFTVGALTVAAALAALLAPRFDPTRGGALGAGVITGITETATGIGGPPLALLYQHAPAAVIRATLATCFFVGGVISLAFLAMLDRVAWTDLGYAAALTPGVLLGVVLSKVIHSRIDGPRVRYYVLAFAIISGLALIVRG